jgi:hypothetical protein
MAPEDGNWLSERRFLRVIDQFEQLIAKLLSVFLVVLIPLASFELLQQLATVLLGGQPMAGRRF